MTDIFSFAQQAELKKQAEIERRREFNKQRRDRILNPYQRQIGVDVDVVQQQIEEKKKRAEMEKQEDKMYDQMLIEAARKMEMVSQMFEEERQITDLRLNEYREKHQRFEDRKEYDLNRKDFDTSKPEEMAEMAGSARLFDGEDDSRLERIAKQLEQCQAWWEEQVEIKKAQNAFSNQQDKAFETHLLRMSERMNALTEEHEKIKMDRLSELDQINLRLAEEKKLKEKRKIEEEKELTESHIKTFSNSNLMVENLNDSIAVDPTRIVPYNYKGLTPEQQKKILLEREEQIKLKKEMEELKKREEEMYNANYKNMARSMMHNQQEIDQYKKDKVMEFANANFELSNEERDVKLTRDTTVSDDFFSAFGQSAR
eukprot:TRINITY_DN2472_c0_g1_i1.p1 TRINITY_DN2472_c0_g1~~TRINITY_DN2472_c0_g1_i1.p1  ORF type:complete len:381 (+),score=113.24 TRINITY_DN2472_c0_g1_i1:31-1143(+)